MIDFSKRTAVVTGAAVAVVAAGVVTAGVVGAAAVVVAVVVVLPMVMGPMVQPESSRASTREKISAFFILHPPIPIIRIASSFIIP